MTAVRNSLKRLENCWVLWLWKLGVSTQLSQGHRLIFYFLGRQFPCRLSIFQSFPSYFPPIHFLKKWCFGHQVYKSYNVIKCYLYYPFPGISHDVREGLSEIWHTWRWRGAQECVARLLLTCLVAQPTRVRPSEVTVCNRTWAHVSFILPEGWKMEVTDPPSSQGDSETFPPVSRGNWDSQLPWHVRTVTLWRSMDWPQWDIFLLCRHPPSFFCWEICENQR